MLKVKEVPCMFQVIACWEPLNQLSPPLGAVTTTGIRIEKTALLTSSMLVLFLSLTLIRQVLDSTLGTVQTYCPFVTFILVATEAQMAPLFSE